jgi:DNA-damage-inducible protein J
MASTTNISIRIDKDLKKNAESFFSELGLTMTAAFNIFLRQSLRQGAIPFEISLNRDPFFNNDNMKVLKQSVKELRKGKGKVRDLIED